MRQVWTFEDDRYCVAVHKLSARECGEAGYPQCRSGFWMKFTRGGFLGCAFHESKGANVANAERIMGYLNGTCDVFGNPKSAAAL